MSTAKTVTITTPSDREIAITRVFAAPRAMVFRALTEPALIRQWLLGPPGWAMVTCDVDLRVGGSYRYDWRHADGRSMGMGGVYREIAAPERLVQTERFDDPWYEGEAVGTAILVEHHGKTTLTTTLLYQSKVARDQVLASPMEDGLAAGYDLLEAALARLAA